MKKLATLLVACFLLVLNNSMIAQTCCNTGGTTVAPQVTTGFYSTAQIPLDSNTVPSNPLLSVSPSADLPTVEVLVTKRNSPALNDMGQVDTTGGGGDVIIGTDVDGVFTPSSMGRYGVTLSAGDTFDITAVGYDLPLVASLADGLLNNSSGAQPCCGLFFLMSIALGEPALAGFCDSVNNAGIYGASDITSLSDVLTVFDVFASGQTSIGTLVWTLQTVNSNGSFISSDCGGTGANNFVPFGLNRNAKYGYDVEGTIAVQKISDVSVFMMYPNPSSNGDVHVYFTTTQQVDMNVNVYDALGQLVHSQTLGNVFGDLTTQIPTQNLSAGMYMVELTDGHSSQTQKLIVR